MKDIQKLLTAYIAKQYNLSEDKVTDLLFKKTGDDENESVVLNEGLLKTLLDKDKDRVKSLKASDIDKTEIYNKAYNEAKAEILPKAEKAIAKKYGIEGDSFKLDKLVAAIVKKETEGLKESESLEANDVKKHPLYLELEQKAKSEMEKLTTDHNAKLEQLKADTERNKTLGVVKDKVLTIFDDLKPVLSKDAKRASNQRLDFANRFESYNYDLQTDGSFLVTDKEGKRLEDAHGNPVGLEKLVEKDASKFYDFAVQDAKGSAGNESKGGNTIHVSVPKDDVEYSRSIMEANTIEERQAITQAYKEANPQT